MSSSGALPPQKAAEDTLETGKHHLTEAIQLSLLKNIYGGMLLSAGGLLSLTLEAGSPSITENMPGVGRLLQGITFPVGLVLVYFAGGELFTGFPMWFTMTALNREGRPIQYMRGILVSWTGNLIGAVFFAFFFTYLTGTFAEEPFRSGVLKMVQKDTLDQDWHVIFLRAILCGFMVTLSMFLGTQNHDGISKALALHWPFFISTSAQSPHTVKQMYVGAVGMMLRSPMSIGTYLGKSLAPTTLGNVVGGALFSGVYLYWVYIYCHDKGVKSGGVVRLGEDDD